ncbi:ABC transporter ATP-binding protein [Pontibacter chitinilyticus]|uniref:ABC transporter ATP-binding protein n=1 Tax=Pontibacter chitinilyticus TaxID=2674989 RepID=UPI00321ADD48
MTKKLHLDKLLWLLALLLLPPAGAKAQQQGPDEDLQEVEVRNINPAYDHVLKLHPLQLNELYLSYEKLRTNHVSNELGLSYLYKAYLDGGDNLLDNGKKVQGFAVRMSQRHYTSKKRSGTPFGFFHGPMFGYRFMVFEENALDQPQLSPEDPDYRFIGRLYQNSLELNYELGWQFKLGTHLNLAVSGALGARVKYAYAKGAGALLENYIVGRTLTSDGNSAVVVTPSPQLNLSLGYAF